MLMLIVLPFVTLYGIDHETKAVGGGFFDSQSNNKTTNGTTVTLSTTNNANVKGVYLVALVTTYASAINVSSISDTQSDVWHKIIDSHKYEDTELWYANYTGTNFASLTVTVTFSASSEATDRLYYLSGIQSGTIQTKSNNGTSTPASVASFTPNTNFACVNGIGVDTGSTSALSLTNQPNFWFSGTANQLAGSSFFNLLGQFDNNWAAYGATTISTTLTQGGTGQQWDDVVACFPTGGGGGGVSTTTTTTTTNGMSAGIVQEQESTAVTSTTNSLTLNYNPQKYNLLVEEVAVIGNVIPSINTPTDNNGLTWIQIGGDVSTNYALVFYGVNFSVSSTTETITQTLSLSGTFQFRVFELTGIASNWKTGCPGSCATTQLYTHSGTTLSASIPSFTPPTNWMVLGALDYNVSDISAHTWTTVPLTQFNLDLSSMENLITSGSKTWFVSDYYPQWNLGSTTAIMTPNTATASNWLETIIALPTQTNGIVTNTVTSTTYSPTLTTTLTSTFTNSTTTTGTVLPEPAGSTDLLLILLAIIIFLILMIVGLIRRNPFPTLLGAIVLLIMNVGLYTNNSIVYGNNLIATPLWVNEMITVLVIFAFVLVIYQIMKRR